MSKKKDALNKALELLSKRWTLRILWELNSKSLTFRELGSLAGNVSTSVLNVRIAELREAKLVEHIDGEGYQLTPLGKRLITDAAPLMDWAYDWYKTINDNK